MHENLELETDYWETETSQGQQDQDDQQQEVSALEGPCYGIKGVDICLDQVTDERVQISVRLLGQRVARFTLREGSLCNKVKADVGGDFARVDLKICANFNKRRVDIKGRVCGGLVCVKVKQKIFSW